MFRIEKGVPGEEAVRVTRETLRIRLEVEKPDNDDAYQGFALVDVRDPDEFEAEHITGAINIPLGQEREFEKRFEKQDKEIVLYDASLDSEISREVAQALLQRGFKRIYDYSGGLAEWKDAGHETVGDDAG